MTKTGELVLRALFLFCTTLLGADFVHAGVNVSTEVSDSKIGIEDDLQLTIRVVSEGDPEIAEPSVADLPGFRIAKAGTKVFSGASMVIEQGRVKNQVTSTTEFHYILTPEKTGELTIPEFTLTVGGKKYSTNKFKVQVEKGSLANRGGRGQRQIPPPQFDDEEEDPTAALFQAMLSGRGFGMRNPSNPSGGQTQQQLGKLPKKVNPNELLFLHVDVDKNEVYEGEQITAIWTLYTRGSMRSLDRLKFPDLKGFWKEIIEEVPALNFQQQVINGVAYDRALLASHALFPIKPGVAVIDEYKIKAVVQSMRAFGLGNALTVTRSSERLKIQVKPLPMEGRPKDFSGAVGTFRVQTSVTSSQGAVNQPLSLKVRIEGEGNAKTIELPNIQWPQSLEFYDKKEDSKFSKDGTSYKEFEILLIPRAAGAVEIPSVVLWQFDPKTKSYRKSQSEPIQIQVSENGNPQQSPQAPQAPNEPNSMANQPAKKVAPQLPAPLIMAEAPGWSVPDSWWLAFLILFFAGGVIFLLLEHRKLFVSLSEAEKLQLIVKQKEKAIRQLLKEKKDSLAATETLNLLSATLAKMQSMNLNQVRDLQQLIQGLPYTLRSQYEKDLVEAHGKLEQLAFAPENFRQQLGPAEQVVNQALKCLRSVVRSHGKSE